MRSLESGPPPARAASPVPVTAHARSAIDVR